MAYLNINYYDFAPYAVERVAGRGIKKIVWDKIILQTQTNMPFDVYIIPATEARRWVDYLKSQTSLRQIFNCVYLLWGHDFIYAGKSVNGDPFLGQISDETAESIYEYQMLFAPNNENPSTMMNWTSDFMSYLEASLIDRITDNGNNGFCKNAVAGKNLLNSRRDLNLNADKEDFAANVIDLIIEAFNDISYAGYLVPENKSVLSKEEPAAIDSAKGDDCDMLEFWKEILRISGPESTFATKVKPQKSNVVYHNMDTAGLISKASIDCVVTRSTCRVELAGWGDRNSAEENLRNYDTLRQHKDEIEKDFGCQLQWDRKEGKYTTNISIAKSLCYTDTSIGTMRDIADFFSEYFEKFFTIMPKYCVFAREDDDKILEEEDPDR